MMATRIVPRLLGLVPISWRRAAIGDNDHPTWIANLVHNLLNRIPVSREEAFDCKGDLQGFRMYTEWHRFRGLVYGNWEPQVSAMVRTKVKKGMTVLDVGGHIGYYTLLMAKFVGERGRVFSFEPSPENFELLQKNIHLNRLGRVEAVRAAIFSKKGISTISIPDDSNSGGASLVHEVGSHAMQIETITLDDFCAERNIKPEFIKMDVEGAEFDVLLGGERTIRDCRPEMLIEVHHFDKNVRGNPVLGLLEEWDYEVNWIEKLEMTSHILAAPRNESAGQEFSQ